MLFMYEAWIDSGSGTIAFGEEAIEALKTEVGHMAVPLHEAIVNDELDWNNLDYPPGTAKGFTYEDGLTVGRYLAYALLTPEIPVPLREKHISRMNALGLLPDRNFIRSRYGSQTDFQRLVGADGYRPSNQFSDIPSAELFANIFRQHAEAGMEPPITMAQLNLLERFRVLPSYDYIHARFGGVARLNEYLGYPDVRAWDSTDCAMYGARILRENGPESLTLDAVEQLAKQRFGPYRQAIVARCGSWTEFKRLSHEQYVREDEEKIRKDNAVKKHFELYTYIPQLPEDQQTKELIWARFQVAKEYTPTRDAALLQHLSLLQTKELIELLRKNNRKASLTEIESFALSEDTFDILWPPEIPIRRPILARN